MNATTPHPPRGYPHPRIDSRIRTLVQVGDETWAAVAPLIPPPGPATRRYRGGRRPLDDRTLLAGILTVLANGIGFEALPVELGYGSGMTCWRRLHHWHETGAWPAIAQALREVLPPGAHVNLARVDDLFTHTGQRSPRARRIPAATVHAQGGAA